MNGIRNHASNCHMPVAKDLGIWREKGEQGGRWDDGGHRR